MHEDLRNHATTDRGDMPAAPPSNRGVLAFLPVPGKLCVLRAARYANIAAPACYYYLDTKEQAGGLVRLPWILAAVYMTIGKLGVLAICWAASLISFVLAALAFTGVIQIYHAED